MIEILTFIFSDVWYFLGTFALLALILGTIVNVFTNIARIIILVIEAKKINKNSSENT